MSRGSTVSGPIPWLYKTRLRPGLSHVRIRVVLAVTITLVFGQRLKVSMMPSANLVWAVVGSLLVSVSAQGTKDWGSDDQCSCAGLDYTDGGAYLVDGNSENDFVFTSTFAGMLFRSPCQATAN